jgi:predicted lysophospholipase L1 biosynthesis ABC-type transport system permease subunit
MFTSDERDPNRPAPAVVSESTAARLWPGQDPLGKRFSRGQPGEQGFEVIGIAPDARLTSLERMPPLMVFVPYWWHSWPSTYLVIKTAAQTAAFTADVRRAIRSVDPEIAIGDTRPLDDIVDKAFAGRRYQMQLFVAFGIAALLIAAIGVYAATAYGISRRRREMNIRVALGAERRQVMQLVVGQAFSPVVAGLALGTAGALAVGTVVASLLFEVRPRDPFVVATVVTIVGAVGLAASLVAARQGLTLEPAAALREE